MSPVLKICSGCGRIFPPEQMSRSRRGRCISCAKAYEREKSRLRRREQGTTAQRGYGQKHERLRKYWAKRVGAGLVHCARCGGFIEPGSPWDLGHEDSDRTQYTGPEHHACNRATQGRMRATNPSRV